MSAESPSRSSSQTRKGNGPPTVLPQQVTDPTILDSVAGFINEVVPASYAAPCDTKDQIQWAHFEQLDTDESLVSLCHNGEKVIPAALILVLGYTTGIQIWAIPANGEAVELLSWRHGSIKVLRLLPAPFVVGKCLTDSFKMKRPLMALCDSAIPGPTFCTLTFISLKTGEQVKQIKFNNPILDVLANRRSVVVTFSEKIAVFDAFTLEDRLTVTTCYISPGVYPNPVALGSRWMAYAEKKLMPMRRSSGGLEGDGIQSYTATVLHAAKTIGRGLRELGETVASSLTGNSPYKPGSPQAGGPSDVLQKGVITVLDIENPLEDACEKNIPPEAVVAHFVAHTEAVVCLKFDPTGMLLLTADKRGHDFHLFRLHPHPGGPALAAVHHLYVLHRGDTTARVQDMSFSPDSRWAAVSTLRGTTHVFPITPYGGNVGVRTHGTPHVVNRMSRFQRSAGLTTEGRSNSPVSLFEAPVNSHFPYHNPRLPPYPHPTVVHPLAQIRQPIFLQNVGNTPPRTHTGRQRLSSGSEDNIQVALHVSACFASPRAWLDPTAPTRETLVVKPQIKPVESIFIINCHGTLVQYDLDPHHASSIPKEKVCDDTPIELSVCAKAQWILQRQPNATDVQLPLSGDFIDLVARNVPVYNEYKPDHTDDRWLSQVEIVTHAGPHRRLWMGPQFTFKTYTTGSGSPLSVHETKAIDVGRSKPVNMPSTTAYPILIEAGSVSSCEQSPKLHDTYQRGFDEVGGAGEVQLKEDLADAMLESPGVRDKGGRCVIVSMKHHSTSVAKVVNPLGTVVTVQSDDETGTEATEDVVIHENCDEALFRPVVAPKTLVYSDHRPTNIPDNIYTKNLKLTTEINYKVKDSKQKPVEVRPIKPKKSKTKIVVTEPDKPFPNFVDKFASDHSKKGVVTETLNLITQQEDEVFKPDSSPSLDDFDFSKHNEELEKIVSDIRQLPPLTDSITKLDKIFDPDDDCSKLSKLKNDIQQVTERETISSSEENVVEEKPITKKPRKPKSKLGVRISNVNKENEENLSRKKTEVSCEITLPTPPKRSWSSIAASKPKEPEKTEVETETFTIDIPSQKHDLIELDDELDKLKCEMLEPAKVFETDEVKVATEDFNLLKVDKSSDDEKISSSQTETTESDDSSKVPAEQVAMDTEDDNCQLVINSSANSQGVKPAKRKPKKKRK